LEHQERWIEIERAFWKLLSRMARIVLFEFLASLKALPEFLSY
jgi:hypothetical protein